jgi:hypothetical protein
MKNKTKKYIQHKYIKHSADAEKKITHKNLYQSNNNYKLLSRILLETSEYNLKLIVLRPDKAKQHTKIINYINGVENILPISVLKDKFKTFFTLDYMNYVNLDKDERQSNISRISLKYDKQQIIIEGYLAITISAGTVFNAYMLDTLKIIIPNQHKPLYFPKDLPDNFISESETESKSERSSRLLSKKNEIMNQAYTIIKYIAIILAHQKISISSGSNRSDDKKNMNAFEIIKVQMRGYNDLSLILDGCKVKKEWKDTHDDRLIINWLNNIFFKVILPRQIIANDKHNIIKNGIEGIAGLSLYKRDLAVKHKRGEIIPVYAANLERRDFNNKFMIISSDYIKKDIEAVDFHFLEMIKYLKKCGLEFAEFYSTIGTKPAFIFFAYDEPVNYQLITQHYNTLAYCSNMLDSLDNINNKSNLFFYLKKLFPDEYRNFIPDSFLLTPSTKYHSGKIYIARPVNELDPVTGKKKIVAFSGHDIIYVNTPETLAAAKKLIGKYDNVLISDYISNPLLFKGRKFHLRIYLIITYINSVVKTHLFPDSYIWTAAKPFVLERFHNKEIHDTHYKSTDDDYLFSSDFNTENMGRTITAEMKIKLLEDIQSIMDKVNQVLVYGDTKVKLYNNHKNGFEIEGIDIMINENMQPILIECNSKPGFSNRTKKGLELQKRLMAFLNKVVLEPLFGNNLSY